MKKVLLMTAVMMSISSFSYAQKALKKDFQTSKSSSTQLLKTVKNTAFENVALSRKAVETKVDKSVAVSNRSFANGVYYTNPAGTFYYGGKTTSGMTISYNLLPTLTNIIFANKCTDSASATWSVNGNAFDGDENNDFNFGWVPANGGLFYSPTVAVGRNSYTYGENLSQSGLVATEEIWEDLSGFNNAMGQTYIAFSDGYSFGVGQDVDDDGNTIVCGDVYQEYKKPLKPFYLSTVSLAYYSESGEPLAEGTTMMLYVFGQDEEGNMDTLYAAMPVTAANFHPFDGGNGTQGRIDVECVVEDEFGFEVAGGIVIDKAFTVLLDGYNQAGVDFGLRMVDISDSPLDLYHNGGMMPAVMEYYTTDGEFAAGMWYYSAAQNAQYNAEIYLNGMFDVANVEDSEELIAPAEGGEVYTLIEGEPYYPNVYTTLWWVDEFGVDNYTVEGLPSWITLQEVASDTDDLFNYNSLVLIAEPLPAELTGRTAEIRVVSEKGADSGIMTITQGDGGDTGINIVKKTATTGKTYDLSGRQVKAGQKGLMIRDGKKFIVK